MTGGGGIIGCGIVGCGIVGCGVMAGCVAAGGANQIGVVAAMLKCAAGVVLAEGASGDGIIVGVGAVIGGGVVSGNVGSRSADGCGVTVASTMSHGAGAFGIVDDDAAADCIRWR